MDNNEFMNACSEVIEILKHVKKEDLKKIPKEEIKVLGNNQNKALNFVYDPSKTVTEQNVSKLAKGIISLYFFKYIVSDEQKEEIIKKQECYKNILEEEKIGESNLFKQ